MNILYVNSLEANNKELARQLASANVLIAEQNKLAKERQEWALHTNEVIGKLNQQLTAMTKERDKAKAMPMKYRRMEFNAQLQNENESLRQQLAEKESQRQELMMAFERQGNSAQEVITELRQKLATALAACKAKDGTILEVLECASTTRPPIRLREALAIQPDDSALKAWLGEPVAKKIKYGVLQFLDGYSELPPDTKIYSPKELK